MGLWKRRFVKFRKSWTAMLGLIIIAAFVLIALASPLIVTHSPSYNGRDAYLPMWSEDHVFGTDQLGRDVYSRVVAGTPVSMGIGVLSVGISLFFGTIIGAIAGFFGGRIDFAISRIIEILMAFPTIILALTIVALFRDRSIGYIMLAVGIAGVPVYARQIRASVLVVSKEDYVLASRALGSSQFYRLLYVVLPNCLGPMIVLATLGLGTAVLEIAGLTFLGLGGSPETPEWGLMLNENWKSYLSSPAGTIVPGVFIGLAVLGFNLLGDGLRDVLDPRSALSKQ
ncbi:MAG: ABC transporter permease [Planctomycetes bacterium]|nr:ABC transporter permease [Planctomycetota bacterium]